jgi:hypothetical protein
LRAELRAQTPASGRRSGLRPALQVVAEESGDMLGLDA